MATKHSRFSLCLGVVLMLLVFAQSLHSQTSSSATWVPSSPSARRAIPLFQEMPMPMPSTASLFLESDTYTSTIYLVNQITVAAQTDVTLYDMSGAVLTTKHLNLLPNSQQSVSIKEILAEGGLYSQAGSVEVMVPQYSGAILGQLSITCIGTGPTSSKGYLDQELFMPESNGSQTLRSVIDSPANSPIVAITNVSATQNHTLHTSCLTTSGPAIEKTFLLQPKQTSLIRACSTVADAAFSADDLDAQFVLKPENTKGLAGERVAGITITTDGHPGELAAFGFVAHNDEHGSYFSSMNFSDPKQLHASGFIFAGVPVGSSQLLPGTSYTPEVALTNFSAALQTVNILLATSEGQTSSLKQVATVSVPAGASKLVKLPGLTGSPAWQNSFMVRSSGQPGDVIAKMMFKGTGALPNIELIAKDEHDTHNAGDHPWTIENGTRSTLFLFNYSVHAADVTVRIGAVGTAWLRAYTLQSNETKAISIGELVASGAMSTDGKALPKTLTQGEAGWWAPNGKYPEVTGRVVQMDAVGTMARNFSCGNYDGLCAVSFADNPIVLSYTSGSSSSTTIGSSPSFCTVVTDAPPANGCSSGSPTTQGANLSFTYSSANTSIATVTSNNGSSNWTATGVGKTTGNVTACAYSTNCCNGQAPVDTSPGITVTGSTPVTFGGSGSITITGTGFKQFTSAPSVTYPGVSIANPVVQSGTTITATYQSSCSAMIGSSATGLSVQFTAADGTTPSGSGPYSVVLPYVPPPNITFNGNNVDGTQSAVVGQQIALTAVAPSLPNCVNFYNPSTGAQSFAPQWGTPTGTAVGGYTANVNSAAVTSLPSNSGSSYTFYWVAPGSSLQQSVQYSFTGGGSQGSSPSGTASFNITGPISAIVQTTIGSVEINNNSSSPYLRFGNYPSTPNGIAFNASANTSSLSTQGTFSFVQLISAYNVTATINGSPCSYSNGTGLDNFYPYSASQYSTSDNPGTVLYADDSERVATFTASMYWLWQPQLSNSIPVSLGYVSWGWSGDAVNGSGGWQLRSGASNAGYANSFVASTTYPTWSTHVTNAVAPCQ